MPLYFYDLVTDVELNMTTGKTRGALEATPAVHKSLLEV